MIVCKIHLVVRSYYSFCMAKLIFLHGFTKGVSVDVLYL